MKRIIPFFIAVLMGTGASASVFTDKVRNVSDVDRLAASLKREILNCDAQYTVAKGARVYYVATEGSDFNNGLSENKPFKTLDKVNKMDFRPGDVVLFRRGDVWRGHITTRDGVIYSAYGRGPKPALYGSPFDAADPSLWEKTDCDGIYRLKKTLSDDVGTLVFNNGSKGCAYKVLPSRDNTGASFHDETGESFVSYRDLHRDLDFYHDPTDGSIYLKSDKGNPGKRFSSIEMLAHGHCFKVTKGGATIDSFCVKYTGSHGVGASQGITSLTVTNCEFGWIGGSVQFENPAPEKPGIRVQATRYGNAIEIWGGCEHYFVDHNYVYQVYDAALTHQWKSDEAGVNMKDVTYSRNLVERCVYALEYFLLVNTDDGSKFSMDNILVKDNILRMSGTYGWGYQRPNKDSPAVIKAWKNHGNRSQNFRIENNIIDRGNPHLLDVHADKKEWMPVCTGNVFLQEEDAPFGTEIEKDAKVIIIKKK